MKPTTLAARPEDVNAGSTPDCSMGTSREFTCRHGEMFVPDHERYEESISWQRQNFGQLRAAADDAPDLELRCPRSGGARGQR